MRRLMILGVLVFLQFTFMSIVRVIYPPPVEAAEVHIYPGDSIQAAIESAGSGAVIILDQGIYMENIDYVGKAITIRSTDPNDPDVVAATIIDGNQVANVVIFDSGEGSGSVLSGITIRNGRSSFGGGIYCDFSSPRINRCVITGNTGKLGGGIYCDYSSSPNISHCTIQMNKALYGGGIKCNSSSPNISHCTIQMNKALYGGGIECDSSSKPVITDCLITKNTASDDGDVNTTPDDGDGGGIYCYSSSPKITSCTISDNTGDWGGGICCDFSSSPSISHCIIQGNEAQSGGGIECYQSNPTITDCLIIENTATDDGGVDIGGGIYCDSSSPKIISCTIKDNTGEWGGGISCNSSSPEIINCVFGGNSAIYGGGIECSFHSSPHFINCTLMANTASGYTAHGGGIYGDIASALLSNCILWNNVPEQIYEDTGCKITAAYSDIQGGYPGEGNIEADPLFVNPTAGDYHIQMNSPCLDVIDAATDMRVPVDDRDGHPRPLGAGYDLGAYEYVGPLDTVTKYINLKAGWNMVSLPVKPENRRGRALFPKARAIFEFTTKYVLLDPDQSLEVGKGYWVHVSEAKTYSITGLPISHWIIPEAKRGWLMIGSCSYPSYLSVDDGIIKSVFGFDGQDGQYVSYGSGGNIDPLECGRGFWVNLSSDQATLRIDRGDN